MSVKIRLQRFGRKQAAYYHIVVADARAPRDGKFIERIGEYNPNTNPASINLNVEKAVKWLENGAQPTDTCRAILSYKGAMLKLHLNKGVTKGALTQEQADAKYTKWLEEKNNKVNSKSTGLLSKAEAEKKARLDQEIKVNAERARKIAEKQSALSAEVTAEATEAVAEEAAPATEETPAAE